MKTRTLHSSIAWLAVVVAMALGVGLTFLGETGARLAGVWSLTVAIISIVCAWRQPQPSSPAPLRRRPPQRQILSPARKRVIGAATALALLASAYLTYSVIAYRPDLTIGPLDVQYGHNMMEGNYALIKVPESAFDRRFLTLKVTLRNPSGAGSCVTPARVDLIPIVDRVERNEHAAWKKRPGETVELHLGHARKEVQIKAVLYEDDLACRVDLSVAEAVLHN
ncbi:hypothetical protein AB0K12_28430 [Nonomuraea sp. NPDC049419]|uniref:hypothetical protein n=1 Tax=Nonomuraea sp. NPDC049419 TaxID=3155772 RepID=UPI003421ED70